MSAATPVPSAPRSPVSTTTEFSPSRANSPAPPEDGTTGTDFHNRYAREYHCGAYEATQDAGKPLARFTRSGWTGSPACSPIVWGGDPTTGWDYDGLESSIYRALSIGTSGVGIWGSDIGGFFAMFGRLLSDELFDRWIAAMRSRTGRLSPRWKTT